MSDHDLPLQHGLQSYYERGTEQGRLVGGGGRLELARTQELLTRHLPAPPAVVLDVGGGPGVYACWLAGLGYEVHLVDPVPLHVEQARGASAAQPEHPIASAEVGDARQLAWPDGSADAVLLLGPLYHLTERADRITALREAARVVRGAGPVFAVGISRFASALDGLVSGDLADPEFAAIVDQDLIDGQHRNPTGKPAYFTTSFFHHPDELRAEVVEAGLRLEGLFAVEGPAALLQDFDERWDDEARRERLLHVTRAMESEPSIVGIGPHLMAVGRKAD